VWERSVVEGRWEKKEKSGRTEVGDVAGDVAMSTATVGDGQVHVYEATTWSSLEPCSSETRLAER
jgi:hypothetical protein